MFAGLDLPLIWAGILMLAVFIYVVLDGFDLGIGMLFALFGEREERDVLMNTVAPVWDGNETWLVMGGGGLFAAFPLAYAILMPAMYAPIIAMLLALVLRGVSFEYRWRTERFKRFWDLCFIGGSALAAFSQGVILGALLQGVAVEGRAYAGGWFDWLSPFSVLTGFGVVFGYALLGSAWLIMKTEGEIQRRARSMATVFTYVTVGMIVAVSLWTPFLGTDYWARWFAFPELLLTAPVPLAVAATTVFLMRSLQDAQHEARPFVLSLALFALCFVGLGVSMFPWIIPTSVSVWDAAAPPSSQAFMLVGAMILIPLILAYTAYAYIVFHGKVRIGEGYH